MYKIYIRDDQLRRIGEVTDFTKLELIPRFNAVGSFVLDLPTDSSAARELIKKKHGIIVKKNGQTIFSGTVSTPKRSFSDSGDTLTLVGKDDMQFLANRLAYPEVNGNFSLKDYDVRTGKAETIMKQYVNFNAGPSALPERRIVTIQPDIALGSTVTYRARFHNLLDILVSIALKGGGLGFNVVQVDNELQFQVYQPADKTKSAFFSPLMGNMNAFEYEQTAPEGNFVIVGGGGQGASRILLSKSNNASIADWGRVETFVDQRDTTDTTELQQSMDEELLNKAEQTSFNFTPIDTPQLSFNQHYRLGDKVSIILTQPNERVDIETLYYFISAYQSVPVVTEKIRKIQEKLSVIQDVVREVRITVDSKGEVISPVVGTEDSRAPHVPKIYKDMQKITKRINHLERS